MLIEFGRKDTKKKRNREHLVKKVVVFFEKRFLLVDLYDEEENVTGTVSVAFV